MPLSTVADVRTIGNLPASDKLADVIITPHLESAERELVAWVGDYSSSTDTTKIAACKEAECCLCMVYLLPVLNTLYTNGAASLQKEIGDIELMLHSPDDMEKVATMWRERAESRMSTYINSGGTKKKMGWYAI